MALLTFFSPILIGCKQLQKNVIRCDVASAGIAHHRVFLLSPQVCHTPAGSMTSEFSCATAVCQTNDTPVGLRDQSTECVGV
jgi:hypothetical protein